MLLQCIICAHAQLWVNKIVTRCEVAHYNKLLTGIFPLLQSYTGYHYTSWPIDDSTTFYQ